MMLLPLLLGCATTELWVIDVHGEVLSDQQGPVYAELAWAWWVEGVLATPYQPVVEIALDGPGGFDHTLELPVGEGEGLVLYAWQDLDGDGALCAPGVTDEPAGLVEAPEFPVYELTLTVEPNDPCAGPESLFP